MTLKTILSLILIATLIILSAGCIDNSPPEVAYNITPTPTPEIISTPIPFVIPTPEKIDISVLSIYDRDGDGILNKQEQQIAIIDYHYKRLTNDQITCLIDILGYVPTINPIPTQTPKPLLPTIPISPIPNDYYNCGCFLPSDISMYKYMETFSWNDDSQYEIAGFDCSQMATYTEWELENCGYNVVIALRDETPDSVGHAWILVEFSDGWLAYECTSCHWVYKSDDPSYYTPDYILENIYDASDFCNQFIDGEKFFIKEFGWWIE